MTTCKECGGAGKIECPRCESSGYESMGSDDPGLSGWIEDTVEAVESVVFGPEKCRKCRGEGEIDCPKCSGTGET